MLCTDDNFPDQSGWLSPFGSFTDRTAGQALKDNPKERRGQWFAGQGDRWEMFRRQNSSEYAEYEMLLKIIDFVNDFIVFKDHFLVVFLSNCFFVNRPWRPAARSLLQHAQVCGGSCDMGMTKTSCCRPFPMDISTTNHDPGIWAIVKMR